MTPREERGLVIAATSKLVQKGNVWIVPSASGRGKYTVSPDANCPYCSCPDFEDHGETECCKHVHAVRVVQKREMGKDGSITETRSVTFTERKTYRKPPQAVWDLAQIEEKRRFLALLNDLCKQVKNPPQAKGGRPRTPLADMIFTAVYKVYSTLSARRYGTDLAEAAEKGYIAKAIHPVMVCSFLENEMMTPVLKALVSASAVPLREIETVFAVDSTGFSTSRFDKWYDEKYGGTRTKNVWVKCHAICGVRTHVCTAVEVLEKDSGDAPQFKPLVQKTAEKFRVQEVSADKAYLSAENIKAVVDCGGEPFIAFKANSTGSKGGLFEKYFHLYSMNREAYMERYHQRSNVESMFSMVKAKMGDSVRSRTDIAMVNEVLCKLVAHNICCLIMSQIELGVEPTFDNKPVVQAVPVTTTIAPVADEFDYRDFRFSD